MKHRGPFSKRFVQRRKVQGKKTSLLSPAGLLHLFSPSFFFICLLFFAFIDPSPAAAVISTPKLPTAGKKPFITKTASLPSRVFCFSFLVISLRPALSSPRTFHPAALASRGGLRITQRLITSPRQRSRRGQRGPKNKADN